MRSHAKAIVAVSAMLLTLALGVTLAGAIAPVVTIDPASSVSYSSAHVSGTVDPQDQETYYSFEYSADPVTEGWSGFTYQGPISAGAGVQNVSADLEGLKPGTEYEVRLVAENLADPAQTISAGPNPSFTTDPVGPPTVSIDPVTTFTGTTAHFSGTVNPNAPVGSPAAFDVNWHFECTPACPGSLSGQISAGGSSHVVEADATGLEPNTDYQVTLVASNAGGPASNGPESFRTENVGPKVQTLYAGELGTTEATLAARVNPGNSPVAYQLEWGTDTSYGNVAPASPTALGFEDNAFHVVTAPLSGLEPGQIYHFRVVAVNADTSEVSEGMDHSFATLSPVSAPSCSNVEFRIGPSARLPDCRAYEQASPVDKSGYDAVPEWVGGASPSGDKVAFEFFGAQPDDEAAPINTTHVSTRGQGGWASRSMMPDVPAPVMEAPNVELLGEDLSSLVVSSSSALTPGTSFGEPNYFRRNADDTYELLTPGSGEVENTRIAAGTPDLSYIQLDSSQPQTGNALPGNVSAVYKWNSGDIRLVSVLPDGSIPSDGAVSGSHGFFGNTENSLSRDGERSFFHTVEPGAEPRSSREGQLYVRDDNGTPSESDDTTRHISASQRTVPDPVGPLPALYWTAAAEHGERVLFSSCEKLTNGSTAEPPEGPGLPCSSDLYLYDLEANGGAGQLVDLTASPTGQPGFLGLVGASDDLGFIYFTATDVLASGAAMGEPNLYLWENGTTRLVATLSGLPEPSCSVGDRFCNHFFDEQLWELSPVERRETVRVTRDGGHLLFTSRQRLASEKISSPDCYGNSCAQVYLYDAGDDRIVCLSCPAADALVKGDSILKGGPVSGQLASVRGFPRNLRNDGERAFFETVSSLVPADSNGKVDVYEWQDGRVHLISSGFSSSDSFFADASVTGDDVFIRTRERLAGTDFDNSYDIYDARVEGGMASSPQQPTCEGDACQSPVSPPIDATPGSSSFSGPANPPSSVRAKRCAGGKRAIRRRGKTRCVAKQRGRKDRGNRSSTRRNG